MIASPTTKYKDIAASTKNMAAVIDKLCALSSFEIFAAVEDL